MALNFKDFFENKKKINEASLKNNPGIPGQGQDKSVDYLSDVERRATADAARKGITPRSGMELMRYAEESQRMQRGKEEELEALAEEVVRANYGAILDNVNFDIELVRRGEVSFPEQDQAEEEKKEMEAEEKEKEKEKNKKPIFKNPFKKKDDEKEEETKKQAEEETDALVIAEIHKRKIANNIIQGEGKNTKHILHSDLAKNGLIRIFGREDGVKIHRLYDNITKIMESLDWTIPMEFQEKMWKENPQGFAGSCKVDWGDDENEEQEEGCEGGSCNRKESADKILKQIKDDEGDLSANDDTEDFFNSGSPSVIARGIDFPMLIHESVKGIYELIASAGIPKDVNIAKKVSLNADVLSNELEDLRYGPYIASDIRDFINVNPDVDKHDNIRESVFGKMIVLPANEFLQLVFGILKKTAEARTRVDSIIRECVEELDQYELGQHIDMNTGDEQENEYDEVDPETLDVKPEEPKTAEPEVTDYSTMRTKDLQDLVDHYLDEGDFTKVKEIGAILASRK